MSRWPTVRTTSERRLACRFESNRPPAEYRASGATLILAVRAFPIADALGQAEGFEDLDDVLFPSAQAAAACPLKVYRVGPRPFPGLASTDPDKAAAAAGR